jgi:hypothetical protein
VQDLVFAGESLIERELNWKLAIDTFGETYHVDRLRPAAPPRAGRAGNAACGRIGLDE